MTGDHRGWASPWFPSARSQAFAGTNAQTRTGGSHHASVPCPTVVAALVVSLASTACGGADSPQPEQAADPSPTTAVVSETDPEATADPDATPEVEQQPPDEPAPTLEAKRQEESDPASEPEPGQEDPTTEPDQEQADQPESTTTTTVTTTPTTTTVPEPERLGDRFEWCGRVQIRWDRFDYASETLDVAAAELQAAEGVLAAATDELTLRKRRKP